jgi:LysM repeat protein
MKKRSLRIRFPLLALALLPCGCLTFDQEERQYAEMRERAELDRLRVTVDRLSERVRDLAESQQGLVRESAELRASVERSRGETDRKFAEMDDKLKGTLVAQDRAKEEIATSLSKRVAEMMSTRQTASSGSQRGYEHVVKAGETVSQIATAYKVTVKAILAANGLANPNSLRVGQKLFIPEEAGGRSSAPRPHGD